MKVAERTKITNGRFTHKTLLVKDLEISVFVEKEFNVRCCIKGYHLESNEVKDIGNLAAFKKTIKKWSPEKCPCRLCKVHINNVGFIEKKR